MSGAAHANGDKVYDIATGYWIEAKQEAASAGRMQWSVYLYDDTGTFVEKYAGGSFSEADKDKYLFAGFDMNINVSNASWRIFAQVLPSYSVSLLGSGTSTTLKQYFSGEQGYAINADYAVIDVQPYSITENGTYTAPFSKAYSPVTVDVQEQPWQPLEDGYSNFWFELTDDTLSPWLNFSAKTEDAVIDWGDGSGEVALDTLTPTHTYAKAGKYIVKVKGVTGLEQQFPEPYDGAYIATLRAVECNSEVTTLQARFMRLAARVEHVTLGNSISAIGQGAFNYCSSLLDFDFPNSITSIPNAFTGCSILKNVNFGNAVQSISGSAFSSCFCIKKITIPSVVTSIGQNAFYNCSSLSEVHCQPTAPPTLGSNAFMGLQSDFIIYVPVGYGDTYKSASGWSAYAGHILEEGQTPNKAMLSRLAREAKAAAKAAAEAEDK